MNQSQFLAITIPVSELVVAFCSKRGKSRQHKLRLVLVLAFHWLKNWREIFKPITKLNNPNSHLKTALLHAVTFRAKQGRRVNRDWASNALHVLT